jgi:magnesium chelatase family protein
MSASSEQMGTAVEKAVVFQKKRCGSVRNAAMTSDQVETFCLLTDPAERMLKSAFEKLKLSMRGYHKILKIARTIADLEGIEQIDQIHVQEAIMYRSLDYAVNGAMEE